MSHAYSDMQIDAQKTDFDPHILLKGELRHGDSFPFHLKGPLYVSGGGPLTIGAELKTISVKNASLHIVYAQDSVDKWVNGYVWFDRPLAFDVQALCKLFDEHKLSDELGLTPHWDVHVANTDLRANKDQLRGDVAFYRQLAAMEIDKDLDPAEEMEHWIEQVHELHEFLFGAAEYYEHWTKDQSDMALAQFLLHEHRRKEVVKRALQLGYERRRDTTEFPSRYHKLLMQAEGNVRLGYPVAALDLLVEVDSDLFSPAVVIKLGEKEIEDLQARVVAIAWEVRNHFGLGDTDLTWLESRAGAP